MRSIPARAQRQLTHAEIALLGKFPDRVVAERIGMVRHAVEEQRRVRGIPASAVKLKNETWTPQRIARLGIVPDSEMAKEMGIPVGATLVSTDDGITSVTVLGAKKVKLGEDVLSLSAATRLVLGVDYSVQPSPHWTFEGKSLHDMYEETYVETE